jgi:hypothetical protein
MNTKQILYNALQVQLDAKKQVYDTYLETITQPAFHELITEVRKYITSIAPIDDSNELELSNRSLRIRLDSGYSGHIELHLNGTWKGDKHTPHLDLDWSSGGYNLVNKSDKLRYVNVLHSLANNLKPIEDIWFSDWKVKYDSIWDANISIKKEYDDLLMALQNLKREIQTDLADSMKQVGFEIKEFKQDHSLDWDYDPNNSGKRIYKIEIRKHSVKLQYGRSQYDTCHVNGFKVLSKKGNKYNIEVNRDGRMYTYDVLEKKFDSFVDDVASWENVQADKRKIEAEERFAERTK